MNDKTIWISVSEAAEIVGYSKAYFRELFCRSDNPLVTMRVKHCPSGRRRILISRRSVEELVRAEMIEPV